MFTRLAQYVVKHPRRIIATWLVAVLAMVVVSPKLSDVVNGDQTSFLPTSYESARADALARHLFPGATDITATFVVKRADGRPLSTGDLARTTVMARDLLQAGIPHVKAVVAGVAQVSPDGRVQLVGVDFAGRRDDPGVANAVAALRDKVKPLLRGSGLTAGLTGEVAMLVDSTKAYSTAEAIVGLATIGMILILLGAIFRSPLAALLPVLSVTLVYTLATSTIALAARTFHFQVSQSLTSLLIVVLFGIGTDYIVFLLFRYRERLRAGQPSKEALATAAARVGEVIASSALAVMVSFGAMLLAVLGDFRAMAPGLVIAVSLMLLAGLTLVPAILSLLGTRVFWPSKSWQRPVQGSSFARFGGLIGRRPGCAVLLTSGLLIILASGSLAYRANYDVTDQLPSGVESTLAFKDLTAAFPAGALNPTLVYVSSTRSLTPLVLEQLEARLRTTAGVSTVFPPRVTPDGRAAQITLYLGASPYSMTARLREEARAGRPVREAAAHAVEQAAPTVLAAGAILAGTFGSLMLGGISSLQQLGFTVAIGIVMAAAVLAAVLVPGLAALVGGAFWWPMQPRDRYEVSPVPLTMRGTRLGGSDTQLERAG